MAWTTPLTWAASDTPTAAQFNTHIRDNISFLYSVPKCLAADTGNQNITNGVATIINFGGELYDNDTMHSTSSNTERVEINTAGAFLVFCGAQWAASGAAGNRQTYFQKNSVSGLSAVCTRAANSVSPPAHSLSTVVALIATDYLNMGVWQDSGASQVLFGYTSVNHSKFLGAHWVGA